MDHSGRPCLLDDDVSSSEDDWCMGVCRVISLRKAAGNGVERWCV
jgi:hypothetical protein